MTTSSEKQILPSKPLIIYHDGKQIEIRPEIIIIVEELIAIKKQHEEKFFETDLAINHIKEKFLEIQERIDKLEGKTTKQKFDENILNEVFGIWKDEEDGKTFVEKIRKESEKRRKRLKI